jgi:putative membrane protein
MSYLADHWSFGPFLIAAIVLAVWHEIGLARLARRSSPERARQQRLRSLWFYGGLAVLLIAVQSPIDYWGYDYFFIHMIQHLLLMFAAPTLIVAGAPWRPLLAALPRGVREGATGGGLRGRWTRPLRAIGTFVLLPWVSIALFNIAMVAWHLPAALDLAETNRAVHIWLMEGSFVVAGVLFWLQFINSPPLRVRLTPIAQATALALTNVVMWILAMAMGILTSGSWYSVYDHIRGVTLAPFADQQIGAGILWVCGDFWAIPCMIVVIRRLMAQEGSVGAAIDRMLGRGARRYQWANRA